MKDIDFEEIAPMCLIVLLVIFCMIMIVTGCTSLGSAPAVDVSQKVNKYDLYGTVNGAPFNGIGVIPFSSTYVMKIISTVDVDLLTVTSCHRDFSVESAIKLGWFDARRGYTYKYNPVPNIENYGSCLVRLGAYNKDKGQNAWGILDFETPDATLPADNLCNGQAAGTNGVSICQSRAGLIQRIVFPVPVKMAVKSVEPKCRITNPPMDGYAWEYQIAEGECVIAFMEAAEPHRFHRHTTIGYSAIEIRGAQ